MKLWIARDNNDVLYLHLTKPKGDDYWFISERFIRIDSFLFPEVTFENSPQQVEIKLVNEKFIRTSSKHPYIGKYVRAGGELNGVYGYIIDVEEVFDEDFDCTKMIIHIKDENDGSIIKCDKDDVVELIPQVEYIEKGLY